MISFERGGTRFNYRVAGVCIHEGAVLLNRAGDHDGWQDSWFLPGGRCEMLEHSPDALRREFREELGIEVRIERLLWIVENFFTHDGKEWHSLGLYHQVSLPEDCIYLEKERTYSGIEDNGVRLMFRWFLLDSLHETPLYPTFLRDTLAVLPSTPQHIIHRDERV